MATKPTTRLPLSCRVGRVLVWTAFAYLAVRAFVPFAVAVLR